MMAMSMLDRAKLATLDPQLIRYKPGRLSNDYLWVYRIYINIDTIRTIDATKSYCLNLLRSYII